MSLSYADVAQIRDLVRRVEAVEQAVAALQGGRDLVGDIQALRMRLGSLQSQINLLRRGPTHDSVEPDPPPEETSDAA